MKQEEIKLYPTKDKTSIISYPTLKEVFDDTDGLKKRLLPILKIDGGEIKKKWKGIPFIFIAHTIREDQLEFRINKDNTYTDLNYIEDKIDNYSDFSKKRLNLSISPISHEEVKYSCLQEYDKNGLLQKESAYNYNPNKSIEFKYTCINSINLPSVRKEFFYLGNDFLDLINTEIEFNDLGFLKSYTRKIEKQSFHIKEKLTYLQENGVTLVTKENENSQNENIVNPFSIKITKNSQSYLIDSESENVEVKENELQEVIKEETLKHFLYHSRSKSFLSYQKIKKNDIVVEVENNIDNLPVVLNYSFNLDGFCRKYNLNYLILEDQKVEFQLTHEERILYTYTLYHNGDHIEVTKVDYKSNYTQDWKLPGSLSLQKAVVLTIFSYQFYEHDFEKERHFNTNSQPIFEYKYQRKDDLIIREKYDIRVKQTRKDGELYIGKPSWYQTENVPTDDEGNPLEFVGQLIHGDLFGTLYLFYDEEKRIVKQIFQCT